MLRYVMKDKGLSSTEGYVFLDESDQQRYRADGRNWTVSKEYSFKGADGAELFHLKQKLISLSPTYTMQRNGGHFATIRKSGSKYSIYLSDQTRITAQQQKGGTAFMFSRENQPIANVTRKLVSLAENCVVEVEAEEDAEMILAGMVAIFDMKKH